MTISLTQLAGEYTDPSASFTVWRNVALGVLAFDVEKRITTGKDLLTGETLSIQLDEENASDARDDVDVWSAQRYRTRNDVQMVANAKAVVPGEGVIIFEGVRAGSEQGVLQARWASTAAHAAGIAKVFSALVRPALAYGSRVGQLDPKHAIELIRTKSARPIHSRQELMDTVASVIATPFRNALIRVLDGENLVSTSQVWKPKDLSVPSSIEKHFANDRIARVLSDTVCQGAIVEVLAIDRIYPGKDYGKVLSDHSKTDTTIFRRDWSLGEGKGYGFADAIVALRQYQALDGTKGGWQLTKLRPTTIRPNLYRGYADFPTANINPLVAPVQAPAPDTPSAQSGAQSPGQPHTPGRQAGVEAAHRAKDHGDPLAEKLNRASRGFARAR